MGELPDTGEVKLIVWGSFDSAQDDIGYFLKQYIGYHILRGRFYTR